MLLYEAFTGSISLWSLISNLATIFGVSPKSYSQAISIASNFIGNIKLALGGKATIGSILKMVPDFVVMVIGLFPGAKFAKVITKSYSIASLL